MKSERVDYALSVADDMARAKCSLPKNAEKPDFSEYSLRELVLLLKKEVLELDDAFIHGTTQELVNEVTDVYAFCAFIIANVHDKTKGV